MTKKDLWFFSAGGGGIGFGMELNFHQVVKSKRCLFHQWDRYLANPSKSLKSRLSLDNGIYSLEGGSETQCKFRSSVSFGFQNKRLFVISRCNFIFLGDGGCVACRWKIGLTREQWDGLRCGFPRRRRPCWFACFHEILSSAQKTKPLTFVLVTRPNFPCLAFLYDCNFLLKTANIEFSSLFLSRLINAA